MFWFRVLKSQSASLSIERHNPSDESPPQSDHNLRNLAVTMRQCLNSETIVEFIPEVVRCCGNCASVGLSTPPAGGFAIVFPCRRTAPLQRPRPATEIPHHSDTWVGGSGVTSDDA
jgi:hypothetical protein